MCKVANFVYAKTKEAILNGNLNFSEGQFKLILINSSQYTANQNVHEFVSDIPLSARVYTTSSISNLTNSLGTIDGDDLSITLPSNYGFEAMVLFKQGSSEQNSRLISYIDTAEGLPFVDTLDQISMSIVWSNTATKILSI